MVRAKGRSLGTAGGGLNDATWAKNAEVASIGQVGEQRTAAVLDRIAQRSGGVTVLHDLLIPVPGITANIDHVVVSGDCVHIIDTKVWKPGRYWTLGQKSRRGLKRFEPAEKKTMVMARDALERHLAAKGIRAKLTHPVVAVWPSNQGSALRLRWLRVPGAKSMSGAAFTRYAKKTFRASARFRTGGGRPANPDIVAALTRLLEGTPHRLGATSRESGPVLADPVTVKAPSPSLDEPETNLVDFDF